ncbi:MAG: hypothetical protein IJD85_09285 [Oscillospiraceae bacterium]|nr:hypothetical protein [Oscillospiraceae bacterium]
MNTELWSKVTDNIDERFTNEAAEYFAKHSRTDSGELENGKVISFADTQPKKRSRTKLITAVCAVAAAVAICVVGGIVMLNRGALLPTGSTPSDVTQQEHGEWQYLRPYDGTDKTALEFASSLSDNAKQREKELIKLAPFCVKSYYAPTDSGEFWVKMYCPEIDAYYQFTEIYFRSGDEFKFLNEITVFDNFAENTMAVCSGNTLIYSRDNGMIERVRSDGSVDVICDATILAPENLEGSPYMNVISGSEIRGSGDKLNISLVYTYYSIWLNAYVYRIDHIELSTISSRTYHVKGDYGLSISNGEINTFATLNEKHSHDHEALPDEEQLLQLGQQKLDDAAMLFAIKEDLAAFDKNDTKADYFAINDTYGSLADIEALYSRTFAGNMDRYSNAYYSSGTPVSAPWFTSNDITGSNLYNEIHEHMIADDYGNVYVAHNTEAPYEYWTSVCSVILSSEDSIEYLLCTVCKDDGAYIYEHSVMRLQKISGEWKISQIRQKLGNEYGAANKELLIEEGLLDEQNSISYIDSECMRLEKEENCTVLGTAIDDFDIDGEDELLILTGKDGENAMLFYEQKSSDWEQTMRFTSDTINKLAGIQHLPYYDKDGHFYRFLATDGSIVELRCKNDETGDYSAQLVSAEGYGSPIEYPHVLSSSFEANPDQNADVSEHAKQMAESFMQLLTNEDSSRTFTVTDYDIKHVAVTPLSEASAQYNITDEERGLQNAHIVEIDVYYKYNGTVNGFAPADGWYDSIGGKNIGFLLWQEGETFFMRSRLRNGIEALNITHDELCTWLDDNLQPALDITNIIYFSGDWARQSGAEYFGEENLYEVTAVADEIGISYSSIAEIKAEAARYFTDEALKALEIDFWFREQDGKLYANTFEKGLPYSEYYGSETAKLLSQYENKAEFALQIKSAIFMNGYNTACYAVIGIEKTDDGWRFTAPLI